MNRKKSGKNRRRRRQRQLSVEEEEEEDFDQVPYDDDDDVYGEGFLNVDGIKFGMNTFTYRRPYKSNITYDNLVSCP